MDPRDRKQRYYRRHQKLKAERSSWDEQWREIAEVINPRRARFLRSDRNRGERRDQQIINNTPTIASRIQASGMMAGITSPARPWFRLTTPDPELAERGAVRSWLHQVEERVRHALLRSNWYHAVHRLYGDLGDFGTSPLHIDEDPQTVLRCYVFPVGQYCLAASPRQTVDTIYRELSMTVEQLVRRFGLERVSTTVRNLYDRGCYDEWVDVTHVLEPNAERRRVLGPEGKPWRSCWYETNGTDDKFLSESGYDSFPAIAPRWEVAGEDVYGWGPGSVALGDARALQVLERKKGQLVAKLVDPPMRAPSSLANGKASLLPGSVTYVDALTAGQTFAPAMEVPPQAIQVVEASIREHEERVKRAYYADVWLAMIAADRGQMTAREVAERHEEKMLQLGPVLESLQGEAFDPAIDRVFSILLRAGQIPRPPQELEGMELRVEYTSIMAQALKLIGTTSIERLAGFAGNLSAANPTILDKINWDEMVDEYGAALGVKPDLIRTDEEVAAIRRQRAQVEASRAAVAQTAQSAQAAKVLSQTDLQGDNALSRLLQTVGGASAAAGRA